MDMSKFDRPVTDRAMPELRTAHEAVWQAPRTQPLFSSVAATGTARPEDFSFFFYSAPASGATVAEDDAKARRLRRLQMLKLMLQQAQAAKNSNGRG
jgi:hypothetical protein